MNELIKQISPQQMIHRASRLPVTGQTTSYRAGDDGWVQAGKARRFQVVDNLVYDWETMLCWVANPAAIIPGDPNGRPAVAKGVWSSVGAYEYGDLVQGDGSPDSLFYICIADHTNQEPPNATYWVETTWTASAANLTTPATMNWDKAVDKCLMTYAGIGPWSASNPCGWRLPNVRELESIRDFDVRVSSIPVGFSVLGGISLYITSTSHPQTSAYANSIGFGSGNPTYVSPKANLFCVLPVRSLII